MMHSEKRWYWAIVGAADLGKACGVYAARFGCPPALAYMAPSALAALADIPADLELIADPHLSRAVVAFALPAAVATEEQPVGYAQLGLFAEALMG